MLRPLLCALCLGLSVMAFADAPASRRSATAPVEAMPRDELDVIDHRELGDRYDPAKADVYLEAHRLLESYFAATTGGERKALTLRIEALGLDPNVVGRLTRVRINWQALAPGHASVSERVGPTDVKYVLGVPRGYDRRTASRLVVVLDAADTLPADPKPDADAVAKYYETRVDVELARHGDALVILPLPHPTDGFGPSYAGANSVIAAINHAASRANVDPARVDLVGYGAAASAAWNLALHYTTLFAAVAPFAGSAAADWQRVRLMNLRNTAVVTWHDVDDPVVKVQATRELTAALKRMKVDVDFEETRGLGHTPTEAVIARACDKLRTRVRALDPPEVAVQSTRPDTAFDRLDWVQMYQASRPGPDHRYTFRHGGWMSVNANTMSVRAKAAGNRIDADADNVESMRFYLNDRLVDFSKPVTLTVNKRVRFEGIMKPSVEEMLRDQLFVGRGWRYFTATLDVDFGAPTTKPK